MSIAETLVLLVQIWGGIGALVSVGFLTVGIGQIDEDAQGAVTFRPLLIPGIMVLWPLVLWRWWIIASGRDNWVLRHQPPRRSHRIVAVILAALIVVTLVTSFAIRQTWPAAVSPVQLEPGAKP